MSKYRFCYSQGPEVRFISHLDFLRTVVRIFRRAGLPVKYSEGFNPHMVMTIGLPLSVGTTSVCDCLEAEITEEIDIPLFLKKINSVCPPGIQFEGIKKSEGLKPLHLIDSALYCACFTTDKDIDISDFVASPCVMIEKKSKRKVNEVNIKDFIRGMEIHSAPGKNHSVSMHLNAGNTSNLKPELVINAIGEFLKAEISNISIERKEIYFDDMTRVF